jgi:hypothetical protein
MRNIKWLVIAALAIPAAGCVESADQAYGYSDGYYSNGYGNSGYTPSSGYSSGYVTPSVNNYYYTPSPTVVTQTRYVPVPVPTRQADRSNDHRWNGNNNNQQQPPQHVDRSHNPPPSPPQANNNPRPNNNSGSTDNNRHTGNGRDRNGDGQPDRRS